MTSRPPAFAGAWALAGAVAVAATLSLTSARADGPRTEQEIPGVTYSCEKVEGPVFVHVARVSRRRPVQVVAALGDGRIYGTAPVSRIVRATARAHGGRPLAAVNASFFHILPGPSYGDPRGLQVVDGEVASSNERGSTFRCFWIDAQGAPHAELVSTSFVATWPGGAFVAPFNLNEERGDGEAVLYTSLMAHRAGEQTADAATTRTTGGTELVLVAPPKGFAAGAAYTCAVASVHAKGNQAITPGHAVLSVGSDLSPPPVRAGDVITLELATSPSLAGARTAIGAGGVALVRGGAIPEGTAKRTKPRHPRTFLGWNDDAYFLFVADGRSRSSRGMSYSECASVAKRYGCIEAVELDGGGSSTLWYDGRVRNRPSDGRERRVGNALVFLR